MEVRGRRGFALIPPNYVSLNDLKERWLKEQEKLKQAEIDAGDREMREKSAAEAAETDERERREEVAVESRKRIEKVLVREVWWSRTETQEEGGSGERREKAPAAISLGERERREKEVRQSRGEKAEEGGNPRRREKAAVREVCWGRTENKEERWNGKRREKVEATMMPSEKNGGAEKLEGGNWKRREKAAVEATMMPSGKNGGAEKLEGGNWNRREKKYKKKKGKAKADETLGEAAGKAEKVPETQREKVGGGCEETEEGGNRKRSEKVRKKREKVREDPKVVMNGRVWVKKVPLAVVDPRAEIECKFADFSLREKNGGGGRRRENGKDETVRKIDKKRGETKGVEIELKFGDLGKSEKNKKGEASDLKENVEGDRKFEIKRRSGDKKGGNAGNNSLGTRFRNLGKNIGYKALDSSLVWVRKEDKSEVCVAGNCSEGVLAKAGESEKKPGRGRP